MLYLPKSCPQNGFQGNTMCKEGSCGYYELRAPSKHYKKRLEIIESLSKR